MVLEEPKLALRVKLDCVRDNNIEQMKLLNATIFPVKYQEKFYRDCVACGDVTQLAYDNDVLVGAIACRLEAKEGGKAKLYIMTLGVLAPYRGEGVGALLLKHSLSVALEDPNIEEAYLHVQTNNDGAIRFYEREGFQVTEMIKNYYKRIDPPDCYILHKWLVTPPTVAVPQQQQQR
jgi:ribosomal protein S18 acetylase RimI-like enzyme